MGNLANKFLEAMNIISDAKTKNASFDRSVQVTIRRIYQENATKYDVEYEGAMKTAIGAAGYKVNDVVWAVIPKNDLTQTLQIIGLASSLAVDKQVLRGEDDKFEKTTPNLATLVKNQENQKLDKDKQSIILWKSDQTEPILNLDAGKIINAIKDSLYFEIGAEITSKIMNTDATFGIKCYFNDGQVFTLDINDVSGNPYFLQGEKQRKIFEVKENQISSIQQIEIFASGLEKNESDTVLFSNFSFYGCRDIDFMDGLVVNLLVEEKDTFREIGGLSNNKYSLTNEDALVFKASLRNDGILVQDNDLLKYTYNWYFKTLKDGLPIKIVIGDNPNTDEVEPLYFDKDETDEREIPNNWFEVIANAPNQLIVKKIAFFMPNSWIYCEVIDEKGNRVKTVEGWIDNADKSYDLQLLASTPMPDINGKFGSTLTISQKTENKQQLPNTLTYKWFKDSEKIKEGQEFSSINITAEAHKYKCEVYTENKILVFTETISSAFIPDAPNTDKLSLSITGKSIYLCKADGKFIGQPESLKVWIYKEGNIIEDIENYIITWQLPSENTMLVEEGDLSSQELKFNVQKYLLNSYTDNVISVKVSHTTKHLTASSSVEITFLKNGQPGTNGTDIVCTFEKTVNSQTQSIDYYQIQQGSSIPANALRVKVFRPSTGASPDIGSISIVDILNPTVELKLTEDIVISEPTCLKATCISEDNLSIWYAYLPIVVYTNDVFKLTEPSSAPYVQFSSSGNITEDMPKTFACSELIDSVTIVSKYLDVAYSGNTFTLQVKENVVFKCDEVLPVVVTNEDLKVPILLLTNRFEYASINGWDGTKIKLDEDNNTILAPIAGFGKKEEDGSFTGAIMGSLTPSDGMEEQGLFGYSNGKRTFALESNGNAWFTGSGLFQGELNVDSGETNGFSWKFSPKEGMYMWNGPQETISSSDPTGGALFSITQNGLYMRGNGTFTGSLYAGERAYNAEELPSIIDGSLQLVRLAAGESTDKGFRVLDDGSTYARYMTATQARFGQILFDGASLTVKGTGGLADVSLKFHHPTTTISTTANIELSLSCSVNQVTLSLSTTKQPAFAGIKSNSYTLEVEYVKSMYSNSSSSTRVDLGEGSASTSITTNWRVGTGFTHAISAKVKSGNTVLLWAVYIYTGVGEPTVGVPEGYESFKVSTSQTITKSIAAGPAFSMQGNLLPEGGNAYTLGDSTNKWKSIWCSQSSLNSASDYNLKKDIEVFNEEYDTFFNNLRPVKYKFIDNTSNRYHSGFISQWTEQALIDSGLTSFDFGGFLKDKTDNEEYTYGLRYGEFIALNTWQIQKAKTRIAELEAETSDLKTRIEELEAKLN